MTCEHRRNKRCARGPIRSQHEWHRGKRNITTRCRGEPMLGRRDCSTLLKVHARYTHGYNNIWVKRSVNSPPTRHCAAQAGWALESTSHPRRTGPGRPRPTCSVAYCWREWRAAEGAARRGLLAGCLWLCVLAPLSLFRKICACRETRGAKFGNKISQARCAQTVTHTHSSFEFRLTSLRSSRLCAPASTHRLPCMRCCLPLALPPQTHIRHIRQFAHARPQSSSDLRDSDCEHTR